MESQISEIHKTTQLTLQIVMEISHLMTAQTQEEADSRFGKIKKTILDAAEQVQAVRGLLETAKEVYDHVSNFLS
jgi:DNA-binding transcriptional regulator GbsR (MarR family)